MNQRKDGDDDCQNNRFRACKSIIAVQERILINAIDQKIRGVVRSAGRHHVDQSETFESIDQSNDCRKKQRWRNHRNRNLKELITPGNTSDSRCLIKRHRHRLQCSEQDQKRKSEIHPNGRNDDGKHCPARLSQPVDHRQMKKFGNLVQQSDRRIENEQLEDGCNGNGHAHRGRKCGSEKADALQFGTCGLCQKQSQDNRQNRHEQNVNERGFHAVKIST